MNIPENFDVNLLEILNDSFSSDYAKSKKRIGGSSISSCSRKLILERMYNIQSESNPKMLLGTMMHNLIQQPEPLSRLIHSINKQWGFDDIQRIITEKPLSYEVVPGKFMKGLVDIETTNYLGEIKTTNAYMKSYTKEISYSNMVQLNFYLGVKGLELGFLIVINMRAFTNTFNSWEELWLKHGFILPYKFDQKLFDYTIEKAKMVFECIEEKNPNVEPSPEQDWECNYCSVINYCGKIEIGCGHRDPKTHKLCSKKMMEWPDCLTESWKEEPICSNCYENKTSKRKDYLKIKMKKQYPWSDEE